MPAYLPSTAPSSSSFGSARGGPPPPNQTDEQILARFKATLDPNKLPNPDDFYIDNAPLSVRPQDKGKKPAGGKVGKRKLKKSRPYSPPSSAKTVTTALLEKELEREARIQAILELDLPNAEQLIDEIINEDGDDIDDDDLSPEQIEERYGRKAPA